MEDRAAIRQYEDDRKRMEAVIIGYEQGYISYHDVKMIRLKGKNINLLIMADYMPTLGEIDGTVEIITEEIPDRRGGNTAVNTVTLENVSGFFVMKHNVFKLLMKEEHNDV